MSTKEPLAVQLTHQFTIVNAKNETVATADLIHRHGVQLLTNVYVHHDYRNKGLGTRVLRSVVDHFGHDDIYLNVHGYSGQPLSDDFLTAWYASFGFGEVKGAPGMMVRPGGWKE